jgi:phosphohistidine phosphatase
MRRLLLLRHAKAGRPFGLADPDRPINARGAASARLIGGYLARHGLLPGRVLCSPARRTRDTFAEMASQWPTVPEVDYDERLYLTPPGTIMAAIREQDAASVMLIGHNPDLHAAAELLIASGDIAMRERLREKFPTCALAVIDFAADAWSGIHEHSGRLDRFVTPRSIAATTT